MKVVRVTNESLEHPTSFHYNDTKGVDFMHALLEDNHAIMNFLDICVKRRGSILE